MCGGEGGVAYEMAVASSSALGDECAGERGAERQKLSRSRRWMWIGAKRNEEDAIAEKKTEHAHHPDADVDEDEESQRIRSRSCWMSANSYRRDERK